MNQTFDSFYCFFQNVFPFDEVNICENNYFVNLGQPEWPIGPCAHPCIANKGGGLGVNCPPVEITRRLPARSKRVDLATVPPTPATPCDDARLRCYSMISKC